MKKLIVLLIFAICFLTKIFAQEKESILVIDNNVNVYADEFWRECNEAISADAPNLNEMINRYADYRLQIYDAQKHKLDTAAIIHNVKEYYQNHLVIQHIINQKKSQTIINQLKNESGTQYRVLHIQVNTDNSLANDTATAYYKAQQILTRLKSGADFALLARQLSDDPSANYNGGDLGYVSILEMPGLPFYNYVKNQNNDNILSQPILSNNAYHIIKVLDKRKPIDSVSISAIEIKKTHRWRLDDSLRTLANNICLQLKDGASFDALQKQYSYISYNQTLPLYQAIDKYGVEICDLKYNGNTYKKPVEFFDKFVIVKLNNQHQRPENIDLTNKATTTFATSIIFKEIVNQFLDSIKSISNYKKLGEYDILQQSIDETIFDGNWIPQDGLTLISDSLFSFGTNTYTIGDLATYIYNNQQPCNITTIAKYINKMLQQMTNQLAFNQAKKLLLKQYPIYNTLIQESTYPYLYQLAVTYNHNKTKTISRSAVEDYYNQNALKYLSNYKIYMRILQPTIDIENKKVLKHTQDLAQHPWKTPDLTLVKPIEADTFQLGQNPIADIIIRGFNSGEYTYPANQIINLTNQNKIVITTLIEQPHPIELDKIYNQVSNDYIKTINDDYIINLRKKYNLNINPNAETIIKHSFTTK